MRISKYLAIASVMTSVLPAAAAAPNAFTIGVTGYVPVICRADLQNQIAIPTNGTVSVGAMHEFCNNPAGYQVWIDMAPGVSGTAYVGDARIPLSANGHTMIDHSDTAMLRDLMVSFRFDGAAPASISLGVVPL